MWINHEWFVSICGTKLILDFHNKKAVVQQRHWRKNGLEIMFISQYTAFSYKNAIFAIF
jgi:hypothetical protein